MIEVTWAPQAIADVEAIRAYLARHSPDYADLVVAQIVAAVRRLESHPKSGRMVPELADPALREIIQSRYRIVYRLKHDVVEIATVFHGARSFGLD